MIALHPADFQGGADSPDGSPWQIGDDLYHTNPRLLVPPDIWDVFRLWRMRREGMGAGPLPDAGGTFAQAAVMLDAFDILTDADAEFRDTGKR